MLSGLANTIGFVGKSFIFCFIILFIDISFWHRGLSLSQIADNCMTVLLSF